MGNKADRDALSVQKLKTKKENYRTQRNESHKLRKLTKMRNKQGT